MSEEDGPGSLAYPHDEADHGVRGGKIIHEQGETGETAIISCGTTKGNFVAKFYHDWSPHGYDRATALFQKGFFDQSHFFRVVPKFLVQFGISYTESKSLKQFAHTPIQDDPQQNPKIPFKRGTMSFAGRWLVLTRLPYSTPLLFLRSCQIVKLTFPPFYFHF